MSTVPLSFRVEEDIKQKLDEEAGLQDRSTSYVAIKAIKKYLDDRQLKRQAIDTALKEADKGVFISQQAVSKWFSSLGTENELPKPKPDTFLK